MDEHTNDPSPRWVFVHGAGGNGDFWAFVRPAFPGAWAPDLPGHAGGRARRAGAAPPAAEPGRESVAAYADWLGAAIAAQGWPAVVLAGHSMGGAVALTLARRRPSWLRGLVLSSTAARLPVPPELLALLERDYPAAVNWFLDRAFAAPPQRYRREGIRRQLLRVPQAVTLGDYRACAAFDGSASAPGALPGPVAVVYGAADRLVPPAASIALAAGIPGAAVGGIPGAGHLAPLEQPGAWIETVRRLWAASAKGAL